MTDYYCTSVTKRHRETAKSTSATRFLSAARNRSSFIRALLTLVSVSRSWSASSAMLASSVSRQLRKHRSSSLSTWTDGVNLGSGFLLTHNTLHNRCRWCIHRRTLDNAPTTIGQCSPLRHNQNLSEHVQTNQAILWMRSRFEDFVPDNTLNLCLCLSRQEHTF